ncbi:MAG: FIST C-terminal domain-containing protein [Magnetospirillum sp.]|nr:FIST C-terminal domain-containing protein [Magnetospirillum sp.]
MTAAQSPAPAVDAPFTVALSRADHWGAAAKACLEGIAAAAPGANVGLLYATEALGDHLASIVTFLRETTRIPHWVGASVPGLCANGEAVRGSGALAVMVGTLPEAAIRPFAEIDGGGFARHHGPWLAAHRPAVALAHGDPRSPAIAALIAEAGGAAGFVVGGLVSAAGPPSQLADQVVSGGLSGLLLGPEVAVTVGLSQGCTPIGPVHTVTEAWEGVLMRLDDRPALEVLKEEAGELIARDLKRASGYIHVALPVPNSDTGAYLVRSLVGVDPRQGWLAVAERLEPGQKLMLVRRDAAAARRDFTRMLADVDRRRAGRSIRGALYVTCTARGRAMFDGDDSEPALIRDAFGDVPLLGFFANGEIAGGRLYGYTGVLALLLGE